MIDSAVTLLAGQLNQYLQRSFDLGEDIVAVSNLLDQDGSVAPQVDNKLVMFLINIEKDATPAAQTPNRNPGAERTVASTPPLYLNLYLMVAGCFGASNYAEALKFLSHTISFFQRRPVFDQHNTPDLDPRIEKLVLDVQNLDLDDLSNLWGVLSGRYLPSILYKVRMIAFDARDAVGQTPTIRVPVTSVAP